MSHKQPMSELEVWPCCPQCRAPRTTRCPICETAGVDFLQVDPEYAPVPEDGTEASELPCGCGSTGCSPEPCPTATDEMSPAGDPGESATGTMVICPTCDEPFVPEHPNRCEWCGHRFPDGYPVDVDEEEPESFNARVMVAMVALGGLLLVVAVYFAAMF